MWLKGITMNWQQYNNIPKHMRILIDPPKFKITFGLIVSLIWCSTTILGCFIASENQIPVFILMSLMGIITLIHELIYEVWQ